MDPSTDPLIELVGDSPGTQAVRETIGRLIRRQIDGGRLPPVLIQGETGTGKGLLARILHGAGPRRTGPFVDVNCAAIPETLLEAELFGFERGAFTDARQAKRGLFQAANRGTLFLDEIGLLPERLQGKLLTVVEERAVRRLGSTRSEPVDVWILTATNEALAAATREGRFREDLYHRLAVLTLALPPLRERGGDILLLARHFLARACADYALPPKTFAADADAALLAYPWPGNVRELANVMERVVLLVDAPVVTADALGLPAAALPPRAPPRGTAAPAAADAVSRLERERDQLLAALTETNWNISQAAARLQIPRNTLRYRIEKHGLRPGSTPPTARRRDQPAAATGPRTPVVPATAPAVTGIRREPRRLTLLQATFVVPAPDAEPPPDTNRALEVLVEKVQSFGGRVEELSRTGIVAVFGLEPIEDAPRRAAHAAMAIQKISERARRANPERAAVRVAIHTGQFTVGQSGGVTEIDVNAKREAAAVLQALMAGAEPDTISVSAAIAPFLERRFELVPAGAGGEAAGPPYRLAGLERTGLGRRMAPFVGRRDDLEVLRNRLASARRGYGQVIGIGGEAGIGKSRLLYEFRQGLGGEPITYLEGHCFSYATAIPYLPLIEMLRQNCRIAEIDPPEAIIAKVRRGLEQVGMAPEEAAPYLLHLLGVKEGTERLSPLSPEAIQARMFDVMRQMTLRGSRRRPLIFAIEDLHWIDKASEGYLDALVESLAGAPILLLLTYRPGYRPPWLEKSYATQMALQPLAPEDSRSILRSVLPQREVPEILAQRILETAEGNPFFLEELARTVGEQDEGQAAPTVPETIQAVLQARIDRLPTAPKQLLQTAAILGREVSLRLLRAIWEGPGGLEPHLRELTRLEFLYDQPAGDEPAYVFKHALTREVTRESLPAARRQALHAAAGQALEAFYADRLDEACDRLAYHYSKAKQADKAVEYLTRAADRAARSYAHVEALTALQEALVHADGLPAETRDGRVLDLVLRQARSLSFLGRFPEALALLRREQDRLDRVASPTLAGPYHFWLSQTYAYLGDHERAVESAQRALDEAGRCRDDATMGKAYLVLAQEASWGEQPLHGIARGRQAVELLEGAGERWWLGLAHWIVGINYITIGAFDLALQAEARALGVGEALDDARIQSYATWSTGWIHALMGAWEPGIEACQRALACSPDPVNTAVARGHLGYVYLEKGDAAQAIDLLEQAVAQMNQFGFRRLLGRFTTFLGEAYLLNGELAKARDLVGQGLAITTQARYWYGLAWAQHALGRVAQAGGAFAEAETHLREALETFGAIFARFMTGRSRLSLAELARARGDHETAARQLREAHALFRILRVPHYVERTGKLADAYGIVLPEELAKPYLAIVRRGERKLFRTLEEHLDALHLRQVVWDRRIEDRRRRRQPAVPERRGDERRRPVPAAWETLGFLLAP